MIHQNIIRACFFLFFAVFSGCHQPEKDTNKVFDQKYVDSTLKSLKDSLDRTEQKKYDSLLNTEAEKIADSMGIKRTKNNESDQYDLKSPKPSTKNLPEPTGPDYQFPEEN